MVEIIKKYENSTERPSSPNKVGATVSYFLLEFKCFWCFRVLRMCVYPYGVVFVQRKTVRETKKSTRYIYIYTRFPFGMWVCEIRGVSQVEKGDACKTLAPLFCVKIISE